MYKKKMTNRKGFTPLEILSRGNNNMRKPAGNTPCRRGTALKRSASKGVKFLTGFTLIELMVATGLASTIVVGIGAVLVDSQRGWNAMYERAYGDVVTDAHIVRRMFDSVVRKASSQTISLDEEAGSWVEVYTYSDPCSPVIDLYAKFQAKNGELTIEYGDLDSGAILSLEPICGNVSSCVFKSSGESVQMILTLDDGSKSITVVTSAIMHN